MKENLNKYITQNNYLIVYKLKGCYNFNIKYFEWQILKAIYAYSYND